MLSNVIRSECSSEKRKRIVIVFCRNVMYDGAVNVVVKFCQFGCLFHLSPVSIAFQERLNSRENFFDSHN